MKNHIFLSLVLMMLSVSSAFADKTDGRAEGKTLGAGQRSAVENILKVQPTDKIVPGYGGTNPTEAGYDHTDLQDVDTKDLGDAGTKARASAVDRAGQGDWREPGGTFNQSWRVIDSPEGVDRLGALISAKYGDCETSYEKSSASTEHFCDSWVSSAGEVCDIDRRVVVHRDSIYECERDNERQRVVCEENLTKYCSSGAVQSETVEDGLKNLSSSGSSHLVGQTVEESGIFTIGNPKIDRIKPRHGRCTEYDGSMTFNIERLESIKELRLLSLKFDDWTHVKLNGRAVYVGPRGGASKGGVEKRTVTQTRIVRVGREQIPRRETYTVTKVFYQNGESGGSCEIATRHVKSPNVNLLPYLVEGLNTLETRVIVQGTGHFSAVLRIKYEDCDNFTETWTETCE